VAKLESASTGGSCAHETMAAVLRRRVSNFTTFSLPVRRWLKGHRGVACARRDIHATLHQCSERASALSPGLAAQIRDEPGLQSGSPSAVLPAPEPLSRLRGAPSCPSTKRSTNGPDTTAATVYGSCGDGVCLQRLQAVSRRAERVTTGSQLSFLPDTRPGGAGARRGGRGSRSHTLDWTVR
jgi:hypothetical protein